MTGTTNKQASDRLPKRYPRSAPRIVFRALAIFPPAPDRSSTSSSTTSNASNTSASASSSLPTATLTHEEVSKRASIPSKKRTEAWVRAQWRERQQQQQHDEEQERARRQQEKQAQDAEDKYWERLWARAERRDKRLAAGIVPIVMAMKDRDGIYGWHPKDVRALPTVALTTELGET